MNVQIEICEHIQDVILFCKTLTNHTIISINPIIPNGSNDIDRYEVWYIIK